MKIEEAQERINKIIEVCMNLTGKAVRDLYADGLEMHYASLGVRIIAQYTVLFTIPIICELSFSNKKERLDFSNKFLEQVKDIVIRFYSEKSYEEILRCVIEGNENE